MEKPAWSFSSIKAFDQCPKKYYHLKVVKDYEEPTSHAMTYGTEFHTAAEHYLDGTDSTLDPRFSFAQEMLDTLNGMKGEKLCEYRMGLTANLEPCEFFSPDVWWRGVADLTLPRSPES